MNAAQKKATTRQVTDCAFLLTDGRAIAPHRIAVMPIWMPKIEKTPKRNAFIIVESHFGAPFTAFAGHE